MATTMDYKGFKAGIMEAPRLTGDQVHGLPPGTPLEVYPVDAFIKPLENWMRGPGNFVVPVRPNKGLWFDWRGNSALNTAIIPTVKGCNPITGMQTSGFHLEKYESKCPKHSCDFLAERFCPQCNYKFMPQNYVSSPNTLWWDGFVSDADGTVRQFFFTEDELRDVATGLLGKENTVQAFGFAFYSPKDRRPEPVYRGSPGYFNAFNDVKLTASNYGSGSVTTTNAIYGTTGTPGLYGTTGTPGVSGRIGKRGKISITSLGSVGLGVPTPTQSFCCSTMASLLVQEHNGDMMSLLDVNCERSVRSIEPVKEVSIGAGAKISQKLNADSYPLDSWRDTPDAVMTVYFVFQEMFNDIKAGGLRDLSGVQNGMLAGLPVG